MKRGGREEKFCLPDAPSFFQKIGEKNKRGGGGGGFFLVSATKKGGGKKARQKLMKTLKPGGKREKKKKGGEKKGHKVPDDFPFSLCATRERGISFRPAAFPITQSRGGEGGIRRKPSVYLLQGGGGREREGRKNCGAQCPV